MTTAEKNGTEQPSVLAGLQSWKVLIPIAIGLGVTAIMFANEYEPGSFDAFNIGPLFGLFMVVACLFMVGRDVGYMIRIRILSNNELSWAAAFRIIMLWEFASAVTPSAVGGTSVALFFINREGISAGRSTGIVMLTSFLDELYFAIFFPLVVWLIGYHNIFGLDGGVASALAGVAWTGYAIKVDYILVLSYGLFVNPRGLKWLLLTIFRLPFLRRWKSQMADVGNDIVKTAHVFRSWPAHQWVKAFLATVLSWTSRYWVVNALILAFFGMHHLGLLDHFIVFGKQLAMWIMMLVSPTPGGSGFAEYVFKEFLCNYIPVGAVALALCWRLVSYYPYLLMGIVLLPRWVRGYLPKGGSKKEATSEGAKDIYNNKEGADEGPKA